MLSCTRMWDWNVPSSVPARTVQNWKRCSLHYEGDERKYRAALFLLERMTDCITGAANMPSCGFGSVFLDIVFLLDEIKVQRIF